MGAFAEDSAPFGPVNLSLELALRAPRLEVEDRPIQFKLSWGPRRAPYADRLEILRRLMNRLDEKLPVRDARSQYSSKVSFEEARDYPVHRWYYYKEGYSPRLLQLMTRELGLERDISLLDPFSGVGTSVLSASQLTSPRCVRALGMEHNPFALFVAKTKLGWRDLDAKKLRALALEVSRYEPNRVAPAPPSATLLNRSIYPKVILDDLLRMRTSIDEVVRDSAHRSALRLALASVLEPVSYARKDGRALRIVGAAKAKPKEAFIEAARMMADDLARLTAIRRTGEAGEYRFERGDARTLEGVPARSFDLVMYSPPYLNGIDYSEVYKVEEWFLGFVKTEADLRRLREGTLRSHTSIRFEKTSTIADALSPQHLVVRLLSAFEEFIEQEEPRPFQLQYAWLVPAYFDDMFRSLKRQFTVLKPGGHAVCVVANSMFASVFRGDEESPKERWRIPLATDAILAELARAIGFRVLAALAVRDLRPRNVRAASSRETILVLQRPR